MRTLPVKIPRKHAPHGPNNHVRLLISAQVIYDPQCAQSGVYWAWNGNAQQVGVLKKGKDGRWEVSGAGGAGGEIFPNQYSDDVMNDANAAKMWEQSMKLVGLTGA